MRILHVSQPVTEGVARWVALLAADQASRGWQVHVACPSGGHLAEDVVAAGAEHSVWQASRSPGATTLNETRTLTRIIRDVRPDVVHLHSSKAGLAGRLALRGSLPTLFQPHAWSFEAVTGAVANASLAWERFGARWADAIVCVSQQEYDSGRSSGIAAPKLTVIRNGVDVSRWPAARPEDRARARTELGLDPDASVAVCVGRLARQKGQDLLLAAWPAVQARERGARLFLVGDGPDRAALHVAARPLAGVTLVGQSNLVASWFAAANVVVLPSRWEGLALTALEAASSARSVVATAVSGMTEVIGLDGAVGGAVVPLGAEPRLVEDLAAAVAARLCDPGMADREGAVGRSRVTSGFTLVRALRETATLTTSVAGRPEARTLAARSQ